MHNCRKKDETRKKLITEKSVVEASNNNAVIQFFLHHDVMHSKLTVHFQSASNLPKKYDRNGILQCDTFVALHLEPD